MAIATTAYKSGKDGYVDVGGTRVDVNAWDFEDTVEEIDVTNTGSAGFEDTIDGKRVGSGSFKHFWNGTGPFPNFQPKQGTIALKLYIEDGGDYHDIPTARITGVPSGLTVNGGIEYTVNFKTSGTYTPAGA